MSFSQKLIHIQIELANGQFEGGGNKMTLSGLRTSCQIINVGGGSGTANIAIFGLPLDTMNQLSTLGYQILQMYKNTISVFAGDENTGMGLVWTGEIVDAFVDAQDMPNVAFRVTSYPSPYGANKPVDPISIKGSADVSGIMSGLAKQMGFGFENAGVTTKLANPYYGGTSWTQALQIARDCNFTIIFDRGTMVIVPPGKSRQGDPVLVSPQTGMRGYPAFTQASLIVTTLYNPAIKPQGTIKVQSDLTPACGRWTVNKIVYELESMMPHGRWFQVMECTRTDALAPA